MKTVRIPKKLALSNEELTDEMIVRMSRDWPKEFGDGIENVRKPFIGPAYFGKFCTINTKKEEEHFKNSNFFDVFDNTPFKLRLFSTNTNDILVAMPTGHIVKMSKDVFINSVITGGLGADRVLPGKYIFALINKKLLPIQVGSFLQEEVTNKIKNKTKHKVKAIDIKNLSIGQMYSTPKGKTAIFLGYVSTGTVKYEYNSNLGYTSEVKKSDVEIKILEKELCTLWYEHDDESWLTKKQYTSSEMQNYLNSSFKRGRLYNFICQKSYSYDHLVKEIKITVPENFIFDLSKKTREKIETYFIKNNVHSRPIKRHELSMIKNAYPRYNMRLFGTGFSKDNIFDKIIFAD